MSYLGHLLGEYYPYAEKQSVYSTAQANWAGCLVSYLGHSLVGSYPSAEVESVHFTAPAYWASCLVSYPGHSLGESYPSAVMQSVYSTAPANWATHWRSFTPLQSCSRCILQPQTTRPLVGWVVLLCRDAIGVFYSPSRPCHSLGESVYSTALRPADWSSLYFNLNLITFCTKLQIHAPTTNTECRKLFRKKYRTHQFRKIPWICARISAHAWARRYWSPPVAHMLGLPSSR